MRQSAPRVLALVLYCAAGILPALLSPPVLAQVSRNWQAQTFRDHLEVVSRTRNLVALCLGERAYVSNLILRGAEEEIVPGETEKRRIECYYRQSPSPQIREKNCCAQDSV